MRGRQAGKPRFGRSLTLPGRFGRSLTVYREGSDGCHLTAIWRWPRKSVGVRRQTANREWE